MGDKLESCVLSNPILQSNQHRGECAHSSKIFYGNLTYYPFAVKLKTMLLYDAPFPEIRAFIAVGCSWLCAQTIKVIREVMRRKRFNLRWLVDTGGMPSAHSAGVVAVATSAGLFYGFLSIVFLIALSFAIVTMFDAAGVRRSVGKQAMILNKMSEELYERGQIQEARVKELLGHTPIEVFAGALLGIIITVILCR